MNQRFGLCCLAVGGFLEVEPEQAMKGLTQKTC